MDCFEARSGCWPPERPRLANGEVTEARLHIDGCTECQEYFEQDRLLLAAYDRMRGTAAPRRVRERVFDVLAQARSGRREVPENVEARPGTWRRWAPMLAMAAVVVLALGGTALLTLPDAQEASESSMFVEDYLRRAVGEDHIETSDPAEVTRFLARELGLALAPIQASDLVLQRAEICLLEGRRGAMIVYKRNGEIISHYVVPKSNDLVRAPSLGRELEFAGQTPAVITWATPSLEQALVGDVTATELMTLARAAPSLD